MRPKSLLLTTLRALGDRTVQLLRTAGTYNHTLQAPERDLLEYVHQKIRNTPELHQHGNQERHILNTIGNHLETGWSVGEIRRFLGKKAHILDALQSSYSNDNC